MTVDPLPAMPTECWPVDHSCCGDRWVVAADGEAGYTQEDLDRADALATMTMRMLTGYRVGGCPVTVRPCKASCGPETYAAFPVPGGGLGGAWRPALVSGTWVNVACGCGNPGDCGCSTVCEVRLPGEPSQIVKVVQDAVTIDPTAYRLDGNRLVRTDGDCWPVCQDMSAAVGEEGAFGVTYLPGPAVDGLGAYAAGRLACEYVKACAGGDCELPPTVTQLVRQGVTYDLAVGAFANGLTGIREVDAYILRWNPHLLEAASAVWSPDVPRPRYGG